MLIAGVGGIAWFRSLRAKKDAKPVEPRPQKPGYRQLTSKDVQRLVSIMIPSYRSKEAGYIAVLTLLLIARTIFSGN